MVWVERLLNQGLERVYSIGLWLSERGWLPDLPVRLAIRLMLRERMKELRQGTVEEQQERRMQRKRDLERRDVAEQTEAANEQHYELPPPFFEQVLGSRMKYSCCLFEKGDETLDEAEEKMLAKCFNRAQICDGQTVLDLGCGWGSMAIFMADRMPRGEVHAMTNSELQREYIASVAKRRGLSNLKPFVANAKTYTPPDKGLYDRIVALEMLEHAKNYGALLKRLSEWLKPGGKLFVHIFVHATMPYNFEDTGGAGGFMARNFFSGGTMPSDTLLFYFLPPSMTIDNHWHVSGLHYFRTAKCWLANLDRRRRPCAKALESSCSSGASEAWLWYHRWRLFFLACQELWRSKRGSEWFVSHYLFAHH